MTHATPVLRRGCAVEGCPGPHYCKGYCSRHYERLRAKGAADDAPFRRYGQANCSVAGCGSPHYAGGYCVKHYNRLRKWGSVEDRPQPVCAMDDCGRPAYRRGKYAGLCQRHAERVRLHGSTADPRPTLRERFLAFTERDVSGCLMWTGSVNEDGYPQISVNGRPRAAYLIAL